MWSNEIVFHKKLYENPFFSFRRVDDCPKSRRDNPTAVDFGLLPGVVRTACCLKAA